MRNIFLSGIFFILSELFISGGGFSFFIFIFAFLFALSASWYFLKNAPLATMVSILPVVQFPLLYMVVDGSNRHIIAIASVFIFYLLFSSKIKKSHIIIISFIESLLAFSLIFSYQEFYELSNWLVFPIVFFSSLVMFFASISAVLKLAFPLKMRLFYFSFTQAFILTEFYWVIFKMPLNFLTSGFILFVIYYSIWDITIRYFAGNLTKKSLRSTAFFLLLILVLIFITVKLL
ncbi:hypothetical protein HY249_01525 [Candidatus Azambacteria bacterium]|nr:hypothetical protein [Candidatus Azambacteria bacterium]